MQECCQENLISDKLVKRILKAHEPYNHNVYPFCDASFSSFKFVTVHHLASNFGDGLKSIDVFQDNTKCSVVSERVSNESAPERKACFSLNKSVGQNVGGCDKGKRNRRLASGKAVSKKKDQNTNNSLDKENVSFVREKENVSSCGSAGTKVSSPGSLGLAKEADSGNCVSLLDNRNRPMSRCFTGETRTSKANHNNCRQTAVCTYLLTCGQL